MAYTPPSKVGQTHEKLSDAKAYLKRFSYGKIEGLGTTDTGDTITEGYLRAQRQFKSNIHLDFIKGRRPPGMPDLDPNSTAFDWATQKNMLLLGPAVPPPPAVKPFLALNFTGTWGAWDNGFGWDVMLRLDQSRWQLQGLGYNTQAFMIGTTDHSYLDMCNEGAAEGLKFALPTQQRIGLFAYSGGCGAAWEFMRRWPADRRNQIAIVEAFGDPNRPPGPTLLGNNPEGHGISEDFAPEWVQDRYYSFVLPGDMYGSATGILPIFYDILVRLEMTPEFIMWFFQLIVDQLGNLTPIGGLLFGTGGDSSLPFFGQLAPLLPMLAGGGGALGGLGGLGGLIGGLGGMLGGFSGATTGTAGGQKINLLAMLLNIPAIINALVKLLNFAISGDHGHYGDKSVTSDGMTCVDKGAQIANALR